MTNCSSLEFEMVYDLHQVEAEQAWNMSRGKNLDVNAKNIFIVLTTVKHGNNWDLIGIMFSINVLTFERSIIRMVKIVTDTMYLIFFANSA